MVDVIRTVPFRDYVKTLEQDTASPLLTSGPGMSPQNGFATAAQGQKADTALQNAAAFATAGQGALADSAVQPDDLVQYVSVEAAPARLVFAPLDGYPEIYSLELVTEA